MAEMKDSQMDLGLVWQWIELLALKMGKKMVDWMEKAAVAMSVDKKVAIRAVA